MADKNKPYEHEPSVEGRRSERFTTPFSRDKRPRKTVKKTYEPVRGDQGERKSFNPNFTKENKLYKPYSAEGRGDDNRQQRGYGDKPYGSKPYGNRSYENKPYGEKSYDHKPYGDKQYGERSYGNRSYGDKPSYGGKGGGYDNRYHSNQPGNKWDKGGKGVQKYGRGDGPQGEYPSYPAPKFDNAIRLNRYIATSGICSRREADEFIKAGLVSVNGRTVVELGTKVQPDDVVRFNDSIVRSEKKVYIVMNKPRGFVTTLEDDYADRTVMDIVKNACSERVYPVGRLDKNSLGVLLMTNDGDLTKQLTHPSFQKKKIYQVTLDKALSRADMEQMVDGIVLEDGEIHADEMAYVNDNKKEVGIEIHSGRNRIVRRMFEYMGYNVLKLDRVYFAGLTKKNLKRGEWRFLTPKEVAMLKSGAYE